MEEQNTLGDNIVWAQVQAEKSRELVNSNPSTSDPTPAHEETEEERGARARMSSNNPFAEVIGSGGGRASVERKTEEEEILEKMLSAHSAVRFLTFLSLKLSVVRLSEFRFGLRFIDSRFTFTPCISSVLPQTRSSTCFRSRSGDGSFENLCERRGWNHWRRQLWRGR